MEKVTGMGGFFFRARDLTALGRWCQQHLGITLTPSNYDELPWQQEAGPTAFSPFPEEGAAGLHGLNIGSTRERPLE